MVYSNRVIRPFIGLVACAAVFTVTGPNLAVATVPAPTWGTASDLTDAAQPTSGPQIALSTTGTRATAVWTRSNGSKTVIQTKSATITGSTATWGSVTNLSDDTQDADLAQLALSSGGTKATAVWVRSNGSKTVIQTKSATITGSTATWGSVTDLSDGAQNATAPRIALSADGTRATVIWSRNDGSKSVIQTKSATISGTTATWGAVTDLSNNSLDAETPQIALSSGGTRATAVWVRDNGLKRVVQTKSATIDGSTATWGSLTELTDGTKNTQGVQIALSVDGTKATAVWRYRSTPEVVQARSATIDGTTATWNATTHNISDGSSTPDRPQVRASADGTRVTAIWYAWNGSANVVQTRSASIDGSDATWGSLTALTDGTTESNAVQLALSSDGSKAIAIWTEDGPAAIIQTKFATIGGSTATWSSVTALTDGTPNAYDPQVAMSSSGAKATAVWSFAYGGLGVQAQSFGAIDELPPTGTNSAWSLTLAGVMLAMGAALITATRRSAPAAERHE